MSETQVSSTQVGAVANVPAANGGENGSQEIANLKDILGPIFGTEFKSDEDALKSVENAKNMSGKVGQLEADIKRLSSQGSSSPELASKVAELEAAVKQGQFFAENPDFNTAEAKALIAAMGGNPSEVVKSGTFKMAFDAIKIRNEVDKSKSVLHTNPRLGAATDRMTQANSAMKEAYDAAQKGDARTAQSAQRNAAQSAVAAVLEVYESK